MAGTRSPPVKPTGTYALAVTSAKGRYRATGLASGSYEVYFDDPTCIFGATGYSGQWFDGQATQATAQKVTVKEGKVTEAVNADLQPLADIAGTVT
jgi:hypothetical protein